jgi:hypothetical protein
MHSRSLAVLAVTAALTGCASTPEWVTGSPNCGYVGCAQGGLSFTPHEPQAAQRQPRREHGWEWGTSSSAYPAHSPQWRELRARETAQARARGLDWMGRPLRD